MSEFTPASPAPATQIPTPLPRRPLVTWILDHNPCLLLSAVLMLLGCHLINSTINIQAGLEGDHLKLISLIGVVNLYEACIIPLGILLIRRGGIAARDGLWLLFFEAFFLVNGTFLNVEPSPHWGWSLNLILLLFALIKGAVIFRGLALAFKPHTFGFLALQLAIIYSLPIFLTAISIDGRVPEHLLYGAYWIVGLLPFLYDLLTRVQVAARPASAAQRIVLRTYTILPWLLLVGHLGFSHWAHHSTFALADIGPLLLGVTIALARAQMPIILRVLCYYLPLIACIFALTAPETLTFPEITHGWCPPFSPILLTASGALLTYAYALSLPLALVTLGFLFLTDLCYALRHDIRQFFRELARLASAALQNMLNLIPTTALGWGIVTIIAAFGMLAAGAIMSLKRTRPLQLH